MVLKFLSNLATTHPIKGKMPTLVFYPTANPFLKGIQGLFGGLLFILPLALVALLILGGCHKDEPVAVTKRDWDLNVDLHAHAAPLQFQMHQGNVTAAHMHKIRHLIIKSDQKGPLYSRILFNVPETQRHNPLTVARFQSLKKRLISCGIAAHRISPEYIAPHMYAGLSLNQRHQVTVSVDQYVIEIPQCPGWDIMGHKTATQREENFGCATAVNMAHMIAEPRDLYKPLEKAPSDGAYNVGMIDPYRNAATNEGRENIAGANSAASLSGISKFME